jgi:hypothetical protein
MTTYLPTLQSIQPTPMFHYKNMIIKGYTSVSDMINKKRYPVSIPSNIETPQLYMWSDGQFSTQLYEPIFNTLVMSKRTINDLIDFCFNKIIFQLQSDHEGRNPIYEIEWAIHTFLDEAQHLEYNLKLRTDPESQYIKTYIHKTKEAYKVFDRMLKKTLNRSHIQDYRIHAMDRLVASLRGYTI